MYVRNAIYQPPSFIIGLLTLMRSVWRVRQRSPMTLVIDEEASRGFMSEYIDLNNVLLNERILSLSLFYTKIIIRVLDFCDCNPQ